jgi:hypothetical protein
MLNAHQQRQVWEGLLSAEIRANYFAELSGLYRRRQRLGTWLILVTSSGAFAAILARLSTELWWLPAGLTLITAALSLAVLVADDQQRAVDSADLHLRWNKLAQGYEVLWSNIYVPDATARLGELADGEAQVSKASTAFPAKMKRLAKWEAHVVRHRTAHVAAA